jgi:hypothetical protein
MYTKFLTKSFLNQGARLIEPNWDVFSGFFPQHLHSDWTNFGSFLGTRIDRMRANVRKWDKTDDEIR